jgi:hypothetical protein
VGFRAFAEEGGTQLVAKCAWRGNAPGRAAAVRRLEASTDRTIELASVVHRFFAIRRTSRATVCRHHIEAVRR